MQEKLPYYMAFPMPSLFGDDKQDKQDMEYLKSMYPNTVKQLLLYVEAECDKLEYEGSMMFDEYPDQLQLHMMCNRIYDNVKAMEQDEQDMMAAEVEAQNHCHNEHGRCRDDRYPRQNDPVRDIIQILLFQEVMNRRCQRRRCRRRYY